VHQNVATISQNFVKFPHHTQNKKFIIEFLFIFDRSNFWEIFIEKYQKNPIQKWWGGEGGIEWVGTRFLSSRYLPINEFVCLIDVFFD